MVTKLIVLIVFTLLIVRLTIAYDSEEEHSKEWVIQMHGGLHEAKRYAEDHGFELAGEVNFVEHQVYKVRSKRDISNTRRRESSEFLGSKFDDPLWPNQWYLHDTRSSSDLPKIDLRVIGAWNKNYTGRGVVVSIIDDGIQWNHTDLFANYEPKASFDINDNDTDPMPRFNDDNKHGTRCAGEVAMIANNKECGVGLAYNAKIGGIRLLDGKITDRTEAESLQYNIQDVDIFSASWGPNDDGQTVEGPGTLARLAMKNGITNGRSGKGTIYVWASGNGGIRDDNCDCDGYTNSIYTLSISSASQHGKFPWYGEKCSSTIATTYSSGAYTDQRISTVDVPDSCTADHTGTSASAPLAAAIVALGLEANPSLTWRDVQHISVWTSEPSSLLNNDGWHKNGRGLLASTRTFNSTYPSVLRFKTDGCQGNKNEINYLEHVQVVADIAYERRGSLAIYLLSPAGTRSKLLSTRALDESRDGFSRWPFMSVHTWGEMPSGYWRVEVYDHFTKTFAEPGVVNNISLVFYGTKERPAHYSNSRIYEQNFNKLRNRDVDNEVKFCWIQLIIMEKSTKKATRNFNWAPEENALLAEMYEEYATVLNSRLSTTVTNDAKNKIYNKMEKMFHSNFPQYNRDAKAIKRKIKGLKSEARALASEEKSEIRQTGGGKCAIKRNKMHDKIIAFNKDAPSFNGGIPGGLDSDLLSPETTTVIISTPSPLFDERLPTGRKSPRFSQASVYRQPSTSRRSPRFSQDSSCRRKNLSPLAICTSKNQKIEVGKRAVAEIKQPSSSTVQQADYVKQLQVEVLELEKERLKLDMDVLQLKKQYLERKLQNF